MAVSDLQRLPGADLEVVVEAAEAAVTVGQEVLRFGLVVDGAAVLRLDALVGVGDFPVGR